MDQTETIGNLAAWEGMIKVSAKQTTLRAPALGKGQRVCFVLADISTFRPVPDKYAGKNDADDGLAKSLCATDLIHSGNWFTMGAASRISSA